jgi:hypothetical protein
LSRAPHPLGQRGRKDRLRVWARQQLEGLTAETEPLLAGADADFFERFEAVDGERRARHGQPAHAAFGELGEDFVRVGTNPRCAA